MNNLKTLVIHPHDPTTQFLDVIYKDKDWTIVTEHHNEMKRKDFIQMVKFVL